MSIGDYDGREATLEIFDARAEDQRTLLRSLRPIRGEIDVAAGTAVVFIFHTPSETARLYSDVLSADGAVARSGHISGRSATIHSRDARALAVSKNRFDRTATLLSSLAAVSTVGRNQISGRGSLPMIQMP